VQCAPRAPAETPCPQAPGVPPELIKPHAPAPGWNDPQRGARSPQRQRAEVRHHSPMGRPSAVGYGSHSNQNPPYMPQQPHNPPQVRRRARAHTHKHTHTHTHTHTQCLACACAARRAGVGLTWREQVYASFPLFHSPPASATPSFIRFPTGGEWNSPRGRGKARGSDRSPPHLLRAAKTPSPQPQHRGRAASADGAPALLRRPANTSPERAGKRFQIPRHCPLLFCISPDVSVTLSDASLESPEAEARTAIRTPQEGCLTRASSSRRRLGVASPGVRFAKSNRAGRTGRGRGRIVAVAHHKINTAVAKGKQESAASCQAGLNPQRPRDVVSCSQSGGGW